MSDDLDKLTDDLMLDVTPAMQRAKSAFWTIAADTPMVDPSDITLAAIQQICPDTRVKRWWSIPGFREWFCNKHEWRQRVEYLVNRGLDAIEDVLSDPEAAPSARVKAFEVLAKLSNKEPARVKEVRFADSQIEKMSKEQLEAFIEREVAQIGELSDADKKKDEVS
jgi:hypothetical protein